MTAIALLAAVVGFALLVLLAASRMLFLARFRAGWLMYLANVALETIEKRVPGSRWQVEAVLATAASALVGIAFGSVAAACGALLLYGALVFENLLRERRIMTEVRAVLEPVGVRNATAAQPGFPSPGLHPRLSLTVEGPFVARVPRLHLGTLVADAPIVLELLVGNHARVPTQTPIRIELAAPSGWLADGTAGVERPPLRSGGVERVRWVIRPRGDSGRTPIRIRVTCARFDRTLEIDADGTVAAPDAEVASASITRHPGARRGAFAWRGDMDLYDTASFQTIAGLEDALGLGARYAMAQTMYLSTRLSLDATAAGAWARHYGVSRGADEIPAFIRWMRERVELRHSAPYPVASSKAFVMELGNHGHLHYATDTSGDPGNQWKAGARAGEGSYAWQGDDRSSFGDQRANILEAARWCERELGFVPRSWAKPGRGNDRFSAAAVEAAGCEVATGSDIRPRDNVLRQPPPHHPHDTKIVELTARYPSDPEHVQHAAMIEFWMHRAHRLGIPIVFLVHQHMRQFDGAICARMTEHILDHAVNGFNGDLAIDTVYGIGRYWLDVLSPVTRKVEVILERGAVTVRNRSNRTIAAVPVDLKLRDGRRLTRVLDLPPGDTTVTPGESGTNG